MSLYDLIEQLPTKPPTHEEVSKWVWYDTPLTQKLKIDILLEAIKAVKDIPFDIKGSPNGSHGLKPHDAHYLAQAILTDYTLKPVRYIYYNALMDKVYLYHAAQDVTGITCDTLSGWMQTLPVDALAQVSSIQTLIQAGLTYKCFQPPSNMVSSGGHNVVDIVNVTVIGDDDDPNDVESAYQIELKDGYTVMVPAKEAYLVHHNYKCGLPSPAAPFMVCLYHEFGLAKIASWVMNSPIPVSALHTGVPVSVGFDPGAEESIQFGKMYGMGPQKMIDSYPKGGVLSDEVAEKIAESFKASGQVLKDLAAEIAKAGAITGKYLMPGDSELTMSKEWDEAAAKYQVMHQKSHGLNMQQLPKSAGVSVSPTVATKPKLVSLILCVRESHSDTYIQCHVFPVVTDMMNNIKSLIPSLGAHKVCSLKVVYEGGRRKHIGTLQKQLHYLMTTIVDDFDISPPQS